MGKLIDIKNKRFGKLVVLELSYIKSGRYYWKCRCDCGNETVVRKDALGKTTNSCGCLYLVDISGLKFGILLVENFCYVKNGNSYWKCKCNCGNEIILSACNIKSGNTKSCGCTSKMMYRNTNMKKYGVENPLQSSLIKQKSKKTSLKKYGVDHPSKNKNIREKTKKTNLYKYGVEYPSQNREIYLKSQDRNKHTGFLLYWKTGEFVLWNRSYEKAFIEWANKNKIEFDWQIDFVMPDGKKYYVDFYLIKENKYIEIKGYMREKGRIKWEWFHNEYPNSELWDKKKLKEMRILT